MTRWQALNAPALPPLPSIPAPSRGLTLSPFFCQPSRFKSRALTTRRCSPPPLGAQVEGTLLPLLLRAGRKRDVSAELVEGALCSLEGVSAQWRGRCAPWRG